MSDGIEDIHGIGEQDEPPLCRCGQGYRGHIVHSPPLEPREGYTYMHARACRGCGALIHWWETLNGKSSPHDADGTSHFATCPRAVDFRRTPKGGSRT